MMSNEQTNKFLNKGIATLFSGSAIGVLIAFGGQIALTWMLDEATFGVFDFLLAIVAPISVTMTLRMEDALFLPKSDEEALTVFQVAFQILLLFSLCIAVLLGLLVFFDIEYMQDSAQWLYWIPLLVFALTFVRLLEAWHTRIQAYSDLASIKVFQQIGTSLGQLGLATFSQTPLALFGGYLIGRVVGMLGLWKNTFQHLLHFSLKNQFQLLKKYSRFVYFTTPATLLASLSTNLPYLLLGFAYSNELVGLFGRGHKLLVIPASLIATAIGKVFFGAGARALQVDALESITLRLYIKMVWIGVYPTLALLWILPATFSFLLGENWHVAGIYGTYLIGWIFFHLLASNLTPAFDLLQKQSHDLLSSSVIFFGQFSVLCFGIFYLEPIQTIFSFGMLAMILRIFHGIWIFNVIGLKISDFLSPFVLPLLASLPGILMLAIMPSNSSLGIKIFIFLLGWAFYLLVQFRDWARMLLKRKRPEK